MSFDWLYRPAETVDAWLSAGLGGAGLLVVVVLALLLGLRHATDPDHLVAVTALVSGERAGPRGAARLGAWWGLGHAATLLAAGVPLLVLDTRMPAWLESSAETLVGILIALLSARVLWRWHRRRTLPRHDVLTGAHAPASPRTPREAAAIGVLHGLGGTGAIVLLLVTALPSTTEAVAALAIFAPMSAASMALCTSAYAWALIRAPVVHRIAVPTLAAASLAFGAWYAGL
jgi:high-affinity nickel permease